MCPIDINIINTYIYCSITLMMKKHNNMNQMWYISNSWVRIESQKTEESHVLVVLCDQNRENYIKWLWKGQWPDSASDATYKGHLLTYNSRSKPIYNIYLLRHSWTTKTVWNVRQNTHLIAIFIKPE